MSPAQIGLIAVGLYLAYRWFASTRSQSPVPVQSSGEAPARGTDAVQDTDQVGGSAAGSVAGGGATQGQEIDTRSPEQIKAEAVQLAERDVDRVAILASSGQQDAIWFANQAGLKFNFHQWNYYRTQATGRPMPDPDTFSGGRSNESVPVGVYLDALKNAGLAGLGKIGDPPVPPSLMWIT